MKKIPIEYLSGLTLERQAELKRLWRLNNELMGALKSVVENKLAQEEGTSDKDYTNPGWPYYRADKDGYIRALRYILNLIPDQR